MTTSSTTAAATKPADSYSWLAAASGTWSDVTHWLDLTTQRKNQGAPGAANAVTMAGPTGGSYAFISGAGAAMSLTTSGNLVLTCPIAVGKALSVNGGVLAITANTAVSAASATLSVSPKAPYAVTDSVQVTGTGALLTVSGALGIGSNLTLSGGASVRAGSVTLASTSQTAISVDAASRFEIGTTGNAAPGAVTVDAGATLSGGGWVAAALVNNGTVSATTGTLTLAGTMSGRGALQVGGSGTLCLLHQTTQAVGFSGAGGTLQLTAPAGCGTVSGFAPGDTVDLVLVAANGASWLTTGASAGTLTLTENGRPVRSLNLAGNYSGARFLARADGTGGTAVSEVLQGTARAETLTATVAGETLSGGLGADTLVGCAGGHTTFMDTALGLNGDLLRNFVATDTIDLTDIAYQGGAPSYRQSGSSGVLTVTDGPHHAAVSLSGNYTASGFHASGDGQGGTLITYSATR